MMSVKTNFLFLFLFSIAVFSQEEHTISGTVYDKNNNETLIGVSLYFPELNAGVTTNEYGFYSVTLPKGTYKVQVNYLGYYSIVETIILNKKITKNFKLEEESESLGNDDEPADFLTLASMASFGSSVLM